MQFLTTTGACTLHWGEDRQALDPYQSVLIPARMGPVEIAGRGRILLSCVKEGEVRLAS